MIDATVRIDPARRLGRVDPKIYGQFIEHLGRWIYGGSARAERLSSRLTPQTRSSSEFFHDSLLSVFGEPPIVMSMRRGLGSLIGKTTWVRSGL